MPATPFPFVDDTFDESANPSEVRPTATNPRFPLLPAKPNVAEGFTRSGLKFAERVLEAANMGRPTMDRLSVDDLPAGLVRAFEAADAAPAQNVSNLAAGALKSMSTGEGELLVVEALVNPMAIMPDPMNGRTVAEQIMQQRRLITAGRDADPLGLPVFTLSDAAELIDMVGTARAELGFENLTVAPGKDYQDLISVGLQGVHEPLLLAPTCYETLDGASAWLFTSRDGNRRQGMQLRALKECTTLSWAQLHAWEQHLHGPDGAARLADFDPEAINALRRAAHFGDMAGGVMHPASHSADDIAAFLGGPAARSMRLRTVARCRAARALIIVGYDPGSVSPAVADEPSTSEALVERVVRRRHIAEAAQKPWPDDAQNLQVATAALRRVRTGVAAGADLVPMTADEIGRVIDSHLPAWAGAPDDRYHPLRMAAKVAATLTCDDHDGTTRVKHEMKAFAISVNPAKLADNRAKLAAERVMPILGFRNPSNSRYRQVRSVVDRVLRSRQFTDCAHHRGHQTRLWWEYADLPVTDLAEAATAEQAEFAALSSAAQESERDQADSTGVHGPATRTMVMLSLLAMAASPAVVSEASSAASPFVVTLNGLGGTRGVTMTTPDHLMFKLAEHPRGIDQMAEIINAALATPPRLARNVIDPDTEIAGNPGTRGYLTEEFLRSTPLGWPAHKDPKNPEPETEPQPNLTAYQAYQMWVQRFSAAVATTHSEAQAVMPGGDDALRHEFNNHGLGHPELTAMIDQLARLVARGDFLAEPEAA